MTLHDLISNASPLKPWAEGEKIPWDDPEFSARMLKEHLSQQHNAASRRTEKIDQHINWIYHHILHERPANILDLCCGPGFYTQRLSQLGHTCTGIDFGPASIAYAREQTNKATYVQSDIRHADYGTQRDLAMLIFGEFNVFQPTDAREILTKIHHALNPNGTLLLEPHHFEAVKKIGMYDPTWSKHKSGLFADHPHLWLEENAWDEKTQTATTRYNILDADTGEVTQHGSTMQAYTDDDFRALLTECGFSNITFYSSLLGEEDPSQTELCVITAKRS
ncbi:MAG: class I SAM-dependent methyltransferase [Candidatus Latescibacteria bacterium]|jgi:trans-aconitate methyltransferase|nr:class I SAM-dependent methyltransferase [Candidatus Latescibacterota bacterium]